MRELEDHYEEEYIYLADLTCDAALISWGKFFFNSKMKLVEDRKVHMFDGQLGRHTSIGTNCESYGPVTVEVADATSSVVQRVQTTNTFAWVTGLASDTVYTYRVVAHETGGDRQWAGDPLASYHEGAKELVPTGQTYACTFRTFPNPSSSADVTFIVIGDTGTAASEQLAVAAAMERVVAKRDVRFVIMVGDTIYAKGGGSGDDDFEWLTTYFQPYRMLIDRIPFYPCMGNHDTNEGFSFLGIGTREKQQDRLTLYDNMLVVPRFMAPGRPPSRPDGDASISPGLFYRFRFGQGIEFVCLDSSKEKTVSDKRLFEFSKHQGWLTRALEAPLGGLTWRIPFSHHPPYCKGPQHDDDETNLRHQVMSQCERNGVRAFFSGHEHNFQCIDSPGDSRIRCFVTGGGGGFRTSTPSIETDGHLQAWGGNDRAHFLVVTISGAKMTVEPIAGDGKPVPLFDRTNTPVSFTSVQVGE